MPFDELLPLPDADSRPFWQACREHKLKFQKCVACGWVRWPPSILCPQCHGRETLWVESAGRGRIHTFAVYHQAFHAAFKGRLPYVVGVVKLDEGPMLMSNIVGAPPDSLACDQAVEVEWDDVGPETSLPKFRPLAG